MASKKPRNKRYQPRRADNVKLKAQLWKVRAVFDPIEAILDQLERDGTIDTTPAGVPIFKDTNDGIWYDSVAALRGMIEAYEIHEVRSGRVLHLEPMIKLANKLEYGMPVFPSDTKDCRECVLRMKQATLEMTAGYAVELIKDFKIKEELERIAG